MLQDKPVKYNLGFGMPLQEDVDQGQGNSNFIQKALDGHPVMRFFAVAGASIAAMGIAGKVVKDGGLRFAFRLQEMANKTPLTPGGQVAHDGIMAFRKIEEIVDSLQGLNREYVDPNNLSILVKKEGGKLVRDKTNIVDSFMQRYGSDTLPGWSLRDELQQKLITQARRLPYEAPGFYLAQKGIFEPLLGDQKHKVNWTNPFDVIGDFSYQTLKNLTFNVMPFDLGSGVLKNSYQTYAMKAMSQPGNAQFAFLTTKTVLGQMGIDFSNLLDDTIKRSHQSIGAFSTMIKDASENSYSFGEFIKARKNAALVNTPEYANSGYARRLFLQTKDVVQNRSNLRQAIDTLPRPFKGMGTALSRVKSTYKEIGDTYDTWQKVISGQVNLESLRTTNNPLYERVRDFMLQGGGTHLEQYANASYDLGRGGLHLPDGKVNPDWRSGGFHRKRSEDIYKGLIVKELSDTHGISPEQAVKFVRLAERISPISGAQSAAPGGETLFERFRFVTQRFQGDLNRLDSTASDWWDTLVKGAGAHGVDLKNDKMSFDVFKQAVRQADQRFSSANFRRVMTAHIQNEWKTVHGQLITPEATKALSTIRKPFEFFSDANLPDRKDFLLRRAAHRLGIATVDNAGNPIPLERIGNQLRNRGFDPSNLKKIRGFLVDKKDISSPWSVDAENIFGFKPLNLEQAIQNQYFGAHNRNVQKEIAEFVDQKTFSPLVGRGGNLSAVGTNRWDLKVNKVFVSRSGKVIDFGRLGRSFTSAFDKIQDDFQIPLIHLKPAQMGGWSSFKAMRNSPAILMESGLTAQPIALTAKKEFSQPDFYLYMKSSVKTSKGRVVGITSSGPGGISIHNYEGLYRPFTTNVKNMLGRYGNAIMGEKDIPSSKMHEDRWKRLFDISYDQENSLLFNKNSLINRWYRALKRKPSAYKNPFIAAKEFSSKLFNPAQLTPEQSEGFDHLITTLRGYGFSRRTLRKLSTSDEFKDIFNVKMADKTTINMLDVQNNVLPDIIKNVLKEDKTNLLRGAAGTDIHKLSKVQQNLSNLLSEGDKQVDFWNLKAPESVKMTGISRRIDQLKSEFFDYLLVRPVAMGQKAAGAFDDTTQSLIDHLEEMFMKGAISTAEKAEGRAAVLSLQMENARNSTYAAGILPISHNKATLEMLFSRGQAKDLLAEVGSGRVNRPTGFFKRGISNFFRTEPYQRELQVNPSGASHLFMPTFGTAYAKHPIKAISNVMGLTRDTEAMSGAQVPITHLALRINKYFENFGIGIDDTGMSPAGFFIKGVVGKRVLPLYAAGATALAVDRTLGGVVHKDEYGNPIYAPLVLGTVADVAAAGQVGLAGIIPGGQTAREKEEELKSGEVPIRKGRYWILGNTPFKGGRIQYFRPSWYRRLKAGGSYGPEMRETPMERLLFGYDFSPLKPFDPYRREREDYNTRPYPLSGDYFTGPWGPLNTALNTTVGRLLKPRRRMHTAETAYILGQYQPVGEGGAYFPSSPVSVSGTAAGQNLGAINAGYASARPGTPSSAPFYTSMGYTNARGMASGMVRRQTSSINNTYSGLATRYSAPSQRGEMSPRIISATEPLDYGTTGMSARRLGYQSQELFGIYGFAAASVRERLGLGTKDLAPPQAVLEPASRGYSASRNFWNLNIGGLGDLPLPLEGRFSNLEISEIVRRFVPKEPAGMTYINSIPNAMGKRYPWLPGADYPLANIKGGDPYSTVLEGEIRLPGTGYARTHELYPDQYGQLGLANIHDILGDVAPWSSEYKYVDTLTKRSYLSPEANAKVTQTRAQVNAMRFKYEFTPYQYKYSSPEEMLKHPTTFGVGKFWEWLTHRDTYLNTKLGAPRTAAEDWERTNVYGSTFPSWEHPISSFIEPALDKASQRNIFAAAAAGASLGFLFGAGAEAKGVGAVIGGLAEAGASVYGSAYKGITGRRFIPMERKQQAAVEEYADIFEYVRSARASNLALQRGDQETASMFERQARTTMYGIDLNKTTLEQMAMAIPKRKREHFRAMLYAPTEERERILSTAPRLERRLFEAAWGMPVEEKPDLGEYFGEHELPPPNSSIWNSGVGQDTLKIKMGQSLGLDLAQMGYYPQQIQEANLLNPPYPELNKRNNGFSIKAQIKRFLFDSGINGDVYSRPSPIPGNRMQLNAGVY